MIRKWFWTSVLFVLWILTGTTTTFASFVIHAASDVTIEVRGYHGLTEKILFTGRLTAGTKQTVDTPYQGLALLNFKEGQQYPLILGRQSFTLNIPNPVGVPSFTGSDENDFFYKCLTGADPGQTRYAFPRLMIAAKELLESSHGIHTVEELQAMKKRFHSFVGENYRDLQHSDMLMRLIGQYFMMREYVSFHVKGVPATDIKIRYNNAVVNGVENWIRILKPHIPAHEVLNYCLSFYYKRSMVSLAHLIVDHFPDLAHCPGDEQRSISASGESVVVDGAGNRRGIVNDFANNAVFSFVSDNCMVSMVETVIKARQLAARKNGMKVLVVPVQRLSPTYLAMSRMVVTENILFIDDEQWNREKSVKDIRLPRFVPL